MSPWKVILATLVIFLSGVFTAVIIIRTGPSSPAFLAPETQPVAVAAPASTNKMKLPPFAQLQPQRPEFLKRLDRELGLTPEQHDEIAKLIKASQDRTAPLWEKIAPQMTDELKRVRGEIRQVLTPEQRKTWAELNRRPRMQGVAGSNAPADRPEPATQTAEPSGP